MTGPVRGCCVEGRRRVTHRADAARGFVCPSVKPVGEPDALIGHLRFDGRSWETGRCPNGLSYRALLVKSPQLRFQWLSGLARWLALKLDCGRLFLFLLWLPPLQKAFRQIHQIEEARQ
jgi:hypothetical protein